MTIEELLAGANDALPLMEDGIEKLQDFSAQSSALLGDAQQLQRDGVSYIGQKFEQCAQLITETKALLQKTGNQLDDTEALVEEVPPLINKAEALQEKLGQLLSWLEQQDIPDPDYDRWLGELQKAEQTTEKRPSHWN